jgi:hypothetical protein
MHSSGFGKKSAEFIIEWAKLHADTDKEEENCIVRTGLADDAEPKEKLDEYFKMIKEKTKTKVKFWFHAKPLGNVFFDNFDPKESSYQFEEIRAVSGVALIFFLSKFDI